MVLEEWQRCTVETVQAEGLLRHLPRDSEVSQLDNAFVRQKEVHGLDILGYGEAKSENGQKARWTMPLA